MTMTRFYSHFSKFSYSIRTDGHLRSLLPLCRRSRDLQAFSALLILHGLISHNQPLIEQFINQCCVTGFPGLALSAFREIRTPNLYLQNSLLRSLSDNGLFEEVAFLYQKCRNSGLPSDNYTCPSVVKACAALRDIWLGKLIHCGVVKNGYESNLVVQTSIMDMYSKFGEMDDAHKVLDEMPQRDTVAWNALISGYSLNGFGSKALEIFKDMRVKGFKPNPSTLSSLFPLCSRVGVNGVGISLHGLAYKLGYANEESLVPAVVSMYANVGDTLAARDIFFASAKKDVAIWNAMISAYTRDDKPEDAAAMFRAMLWDDVKPDMVSFVSLIAASESLGSFWYVELFHAYVVKFGFENELSVIAAILSSYAKLGDIKAAEFLFCNLRMRNLLVWNSMVSAYAGHGLWAQSLDAFCLMQIDGFVPDAVSVVCLISTCSGLNASHLGKSAHGFVIRKGIELSHNAENALLAFYCDQNELDYAFRIFERMFHKNIVSWNTMISGCVDNGDPEMAMLLFHQTRKVGMNFDLVTLISILPSCHECQNSILGLAIHSYAIRTALTTDISLANALISMYVNGDELDMARALFEDMPDKNLVSWNAILTGYRHHSLWTETIELFHRLMEEEGKLNLVTLLNVLPACRTALQGKSLHACVTRRMIPLKTPLITSLIIMYARFQNLKMCLLLFDVGDKKNISLWNTVMSAYLLSRNGAIAFSLFSDMLRSETEPDHVTALNVISACLHLKNMDISNSVLAYLVRKGFDRKVTIGNALIDLYAKSGSISSAQKLFEALPCKDIISWSTMINAYGLHGDVESALNLYFWMRFLGLRPDKVTYMSVLSACSHAGCVAQGRKVFDYMIQDGVLPGLEHYACLIDLLSRTGHLHEAYEVAKNLLHVNVLESLIGACVNYGDYMLGAKIGHLLMEMNSCDSGPYVVLHNLYAAAGKWVEADGVRWVMERRQLIKAPGISLVNGIAG